MVDLKIHKMENELRSYIGRFIANGSKQTSHPLCKTLQTVKEYGRPAFLCGGAVRDILLTKGHIVPRDLDVIFGYVSMEEISSLFAAYPNKRRTRFGGLSIQIKDWSIDIWPVLKTWAFKEGHVSGKGFADFPKTTFLDIDAVAIQLFSKRRQKRKIYSKGFFEAILNKTIEINLEDNLCPATCIVKTLVIANKFNFDLGPRLANYIVRYSSQIDPEELIEIHRARYGDIRVSLEKLHSYMKTIKEQLRVSSKQPVRLPTTRKQYRSSALFSPR